MKKKKSKKKPQELGGKKKAQELGGEKEAQELGGKKEQELGGEKAQELADEKKKNTPGVKKKETPELERINSPEELGEVWQDFLGKKFSATELEALRKEFEELPECQGRDQLTREEFDAAVKAMKNNKATGQDGIPAEVWKHSKVAKDELFTFLQQVWCK